MCNLVFGMYMLASVEFMSSSASSKSKQQPPKPAALKLLLNSIQTALAREILCRGDTVCELFCGYGRNVQMFKSLGCSSYVGIDPIADAIQRASAAADSSPGNAVAESAVDVDTSAVADADGQFEDDAMCISPPAQLQPPTHQIFSSHFQTANPFESPHIMQTPSTHDALCCFGKLQLAFSNADAARGAMAGIGAALKPGGVFFGTLPDSSEIWRRTRDKGCAAGPCYTLTLASKNPDAIGCKYKIKMKDGKGEQSFPLVNAPFLCDLAVSVGLHCILFQNAGEFYREHRSTLLAAAGSLSKEELDVIALDAVFVFRKQA